jgi:DUF917 family protein
MYTNDSTCDGRMREMRESNKTNGNFFYIFPFAMNSLYRPIVIYHFIFQISDVERKTVGGFARGTLTISPFVDDPVFRKTLTIKFQNENLIASFIEEGRYIKILANLIFITFIKTLQFIKKTVCS